ncbi:hypothetical protein C8R43DRAFT_38347 [Mycena crocata]|nr:hypothetical protein C8R43DRAFT_38347 [Mycena crocata]
MSYSVRAEVVARGIESLNLGWVLCARCVRCQRGIYLCLTQQPFWGTSQTYINPLHSVRSLHPLPPSPPLLTTPIHSLHIFTYLHNRTLSYRSPVHPSHMTSFIPYLSFILRYPSVRSLPSIQPRLTYPLHPSSYPSFNRSLPALYLSTCYDFSLPFISTPFHTALLPTALLPSSTISIPFHHTQPCIHPHYPPSRCSHIHLSIPHIIYYLTPVAQLSFPSLHYLSPPLFLFTYACFLHLVLTSIRIQPPSILFLLTYLFTHLPYLSLLTPTPRYFIYLPRIQYSPRY